MKKRNGIIATTCALLVLFTGCVGTNSQPTVGYLYQKQSKNKLYFYSSDAKLDTFLNDFYLRHSRSEEETAINAMQLGDGGTAWKAWETMSLVWFERTSVKIVFLR